MSQVVCFIVLSTPCCYPCDWLAFNIVIILTCHLRVVVCMFRDESNTLIRLGYQHVRQFEIIVGCYFLVLPCQSSMLDKSDTNRYVDSKPFLSEFAECLHCHAKSLWHPRKQTCGCSRKYSVRHEMSRYNGLLQTGVSRSWLLTWNPNIVRLTVHADNLWRSLKMWKRLPHLYCSCWCPEHRCTNYSGLIILKKNWINGTECHIWTVRDGARRIDARKYSFLSI